MNAAIELVGAGWLDVRGNSGAPRTVRALAGAEMDVYLRVLHPARSLVGSTYQDVAWADVARANGTIMHGAAEWGSICGSWTLEEQPPLWTVSPDVGELPDTVAPRLIETLESGGAMIGGGTWAGYADQWDDLGLPPAIVNANGRDISAYWLESERIITSPDGAVRHNINMMWSGDGRWCVASDVDLYSTVVGADRSSAAAVLSCGLEVFEVPGDQHLTWDSDVINPLPDGPAY